MKIVIATIVALIILTLTVLAVDVPTVVFDRSQVRFDAERLEAGYADFELTPVGHALLLSAKTCYIELDDTEDISMISFSSSDREVLGRFEVEDVFGDIATVDSPTRAQRINSRFGRRDLGADPIFVDVEYSREGKRYAVLMVFPVTVTSDGEAVFNQSIAIYIGSRLLQKDDLIFKQPWSVADAEDDLEGPIGSPQQNCIDYVIITSPDLAEPFEILAAYKASTGYMTSIVFVEDILPAYNGCDDAEKLREYLKQFHAQGGQYVLFGGDETLVPIRYAYPLTTDEVPELRDQQICDLYFADLTGEWDADNDGVWGERTHDQADIVTELSIGRLPFSTVTEVANYIDKLIAYETNPGDGNRDYLNNAFFFSSDQMRDYSGGGQHYRIAEVYPENFLIDTAHGIEMLRGDDPNPCNLPSKDLESILSEGYGIVNIIAHGQCESFCVRSSGYNEWPKSYFTTDTTTGHGIVSNLTGNERSSLYYSLACNTGAYDLDQPPSNPNVAKTLLSLKDAGAVAFVANSRWGWVGSSHLLQRAFFDSLFAHPDLPAVEAMNKSKQRYYYIRDVVYGQNFLGDPTLRIYADIPDNLSISTTILDDDNLKIRITSDQEQVDNCEIVISSNGNILGRYQSDVQGSVTCNYDFVTGEEYVIAAVKTGHSIDRGTYVPAVAADCDENDDLIPERFALEQNYPNPFNPVTTIRFDLGKHGSADLSVYNSLGQKVTTIIHEALSPGTHEAVWNGTDHNQNPVASGVYFYRLATSEF
ncbi:MAG: C25 family cysteine peptidase, partial [candidate division Zixibacteria bacterium]|nr:C25 family cysteine peptidase [candidate division Zixibacteria bacterium]